MKKELKKKLVLASIAVAFLILLEQYVTYGVWFSIEQLHHETFALIFVALAIFVWVVV